MTIAAGIFNGGMLGNLFSASSDHLEVPNPILIGDHADGIAFNMADAFILTGNLMLMVSLCVLTIRYRDYLPQAAGIPAYAHASDTSFNLTGSRSRFVAYIARSASRIRSSIVGDVITSVPAKPMLAL